MYEYFNGQLVRKEGHFVVLDVHGIGYKLHVPTNLLGQLPMEGVQVFLYVSWVVREVSQTLYGFATQEIRDLFELLITLPGIGPKIALALISHFEPADLADVVRTGNCLALAQVPGIGKKTAEKLIIELKNRLKLTFFPKISHSSKTQDALNALLRLGYSQANAEHAIQKALENLKEETDLPTLITTALKFQNRIHN